MDNYTSGLKERKEFKEPYTSPDDSRLEWLQNDFLAYLKAWEESVQSRNRLYEEAKNENAP